MARIFSLNSPLYRFAVRLWDIVKLNILWLVFSLPIVTIGASTVAAYSVTLKMVEDQEGDIGKQFIKGFKENIKQGMILGIITLVLAYLVYLNFEIFNKIEGSPMIALVAAIIIAFFGLAYMTYAYALCARYENTLIGTLQNASAISMRYFLRTFFLWVIIAVLIVLFMFNTTLMFIGFLIGPSSVFLTVSSFAMKAFKQIDKENNA